MVFANFFYCFAFSIEGLPHRSQTGASKCATELPKITVAGPTMMVFCEMLWKLATQGLSSCSQNTPNLPKELPKSPEELPQSSRRHRRGPLLSSAPLCFSPCLPPTLCLPLPSRLSSPLLSFPLLSSPLFLSSLCVSSPQALPEEKARLTARERLNKVFIKSPPLGARSNFLLPSQGMGGGVGVGGEGGRGARVGGGRGGRGGMSRSWRCPRGARCAAAETAAVPAVLLPRGTDGCDPSFET